MSRSHDKSDSPKGQAQPSRVGPRADVRPSTDRSRAGDVPIAQQATTERAEQAQQYGALMRLQRLAGNQAVADLVAPKYPVQRKPPAAAPTAAPVARPNLSSLRTIAQGYVGDYFSAARAGLQDFERDVQSDFNWSAFWVNVGGNVVWALASFSTGGTAFVISMAGIAISTAASANAVTNAPDFHRETALKINEVVTYLNNQVDRVTRDVDAEATANSWEDNQTRTALLKRLVQDDYITTSQGGLPNLSQPLVASSIREELLIRASQQKVTKGVGRLVYGPGYFHELWKIQGAVEYTESPYAGPTVPNIMPQENWFYGIDRAQLVNVSPDIPNINQAINDVYKTRGTRIDATKWKIEKRLELKQDDFFDITFYLDADNKLTKWEAPSLAHFMKFRGYDVDRYMASLLQMIQGHSGSAIPKVSQLTT